MPVLNNTISSQTTSLTRLNNQPFLLSYRRIVIMGSVLLAVVLLLIHLLAETPFSLVQRLLGLVLGLSSIFLITKYFLDEKFHRLPFLEYGILQMYIYWGMIVVTGGNSKKMTYNSASITSALFAGVVVLIFVIVGYPIGLKIGNFLQPRLKNLLPTLRTVNLGPVFIPWLIITLFINAGAAERLPGSIKQTVAIIGSYYPLLAYLFISGKTHGIKANRWRILVTVFLLSLSGFMTGMMEIVVRPILVAGVLWMVTSKKLPWKWVLGVICVIVILNPAKHIYRRVAWQDPKEHYATDVGLTIERWWDSIVGAWSGENSEESNLDELFARLDDISSAAVCFSLVPSVVPYDHGKMWVYILTSWIPRFLYPDKPDYTTIFNDRYNITFNMQTAEGAETSTSNYPLISDGYWNFGWFGIVFVGLVLGIIIGVVTNSFLLDTWAGLSIGITMFVIQHANTRLAYHTNGIFQHFVGITIACWILWFFSLNWKYPSKTS